MNNNYIDDSAIKLVNQHHQQIKAQERITSKNPKALKNIQKKKLYTTKKALLVTGLTAAIVIGAFAVKNKEKPQTPIQSYYTTVTVEKGDTVWDIAKDKLDGSGYSDVRDFVAAILKINNLGINPHIEAGYSLIVPQEVTEKIIEESQAQEEYEASLVKAYYEKEIEYGDTLTQIAASNLENSGYDNYMDYMDYIAAENNINPREILQKGDVIKVILRVPEDEVEERGLTLYNKAK